MGVFIKNIQCYREIGPLKKDEDTLMGGVENEQLIIRGIGATTRCIILNINIIIWI